MILSKTPLKLNNFVWICLALFKLRRYAQILCLLSYVSPPYAPDSSVLPPPPQSDNVIYL